MSDRTAPRTSTDQPANTRLDLHARTISVRYRRGRFARIKHGYPGKRQSWLARFNNGYPSAKDRRYYDPELAMELIDNTGELPSGKHDLVVVLTEYRHALYDLASRALADQVPPPTALIARRLTSSSTS